MRNFKLKDWHLFVCIFLLTFLLFWQKGLLDFLSVEKLAGRDLAGNYGLAQLMEQFIQRGRISGWSNLWFAGFPAFEFYPPFFFLLANSLEIFSLGLISLKMSYKLLVFLSVFAFPPIVFYSFRKMGFGSVESFFVSVFSLAFLFLNGSFSAAYRTLNLGLVTQMFALNLLFLSFAFMSSKENKKETAFAGLLLGLLSVSHPFVSIFAAIAWFVFFTLGEKRKMTLIGIIALPIASGWWINASTHMGFMSHYTSASCISKFPLILAPFILASIKKNKKVIALLSLFASSLFVWKFGPPYLQAFKFMFYTVGFGYILAGLGTFRIYTFLKEGMGKLNLPREDIASLMIIGILLVSILYGVFNADFNPQFRTERETGNLLEEIKGLPEGRILLEPESRKEKYVLSSRIPTETGKEVLNELHVDSSISSPYTLLARGLAFTERVENPVCELCGRVEAKNRTLETLLERYNVRFLITRDSNLTKPSMFRLRKKVGDYRVYGVEKSDKRYYEVLDRKPIGIVASINKWKKFNEEIIRKGLGNLTFVRLEEEDGEEKFSEIFSLKNKTIREVIRKAGKTELEKTANATVSDFSYSDGEISFRIDSENKVPVLLKFSYYPKWKLDGGKVYWANPSLMVVQGKGNIEVSWVSNRF